MAEFFLMKTFRSMLDLFFLTAASFAVYEELLDSISAIELPVNSHENRIVIGLSIFFIIIRIIWFIYDKFVLERQERMLEIKNKINKQEKS